MTHLINRIKQYIKNIKRYIDDSLEERNRDMEKWKEEDPEAYYDYIALQYEDKP